MSHYDWESGTIKLPTAAVAGVKKAVRDAAKAHRDTVLKEAQAFRRRHPTTSAEKYQAAIDDDRHLPPDEAVADEIRYVLGGTGPRQVRHPDLDNVLGPAPTNRTTRFQLGEARITFQGSSVTWWSGDNNHQVERARSHPIAKAFFAALDRVSWTRGSGGVLSGSDEYHTESREAGDGANYVTDRYGPDYPRRQPARRDAPFYGRF